MIFNNYRCSICPTYSDAIQDHETHKVLHEYGEKASPFLCRFCGQYFWFKYLLGIHIRKFHSAESENKLAPVFRNIELCAESVKDVNVSEPCECFRTI